MAECHEMNAGDVYMCGECGLELEVVNECAECGTEDATCAAEPCTFVCCGLPLELKEED